MTTTEKNAEIARFMGLEISTNPTDGYDYGTWYKPSNIQGEVTPSPVLYHSDYSWIMPVVEKIEKEHCWVTIRGCMVEMPNIIAISRPTKLEAIHNACFQFIQWYNQQKP